MDQSYLNNIACYKCGKLGHKSSSCQSETRLCYNCNDPSHESDYCPHPPTNQFKQCYSCLGFGHKAADCTYGPPRIGPIGMGHACYICGKNGHMARNCQLGMAGNSARGVPPMGQADLSYANDDRVCYSCHKPGHIARHCPEVKKCYNCHGVGHFSRDCTARPAAEGADGAQDVEGGEGLEGDEMHALGDQGVAGGAAFNNYSNNMNNNFGHGFEGQDAFPTGGRPPLKCYNCGGFNHRARDCTQPNTGGYKNPDPRICYTCQKPGHISANCPSAHYTSSFNYDTTSDQQAGNTY